MMKNNNTFDLIVIGGGPAGAVLAALTSMAGRRVLLLEKESHPRYQIGESLLPSIRAIGELLGVEQKLKEADFIVKHGATFSWGREPNELWTMNFGQASTSDELRNPATPYAYNVKRQKLDRILLDAAQQKGADVRERHVVNRILCENDRIVGVEYTDDRGKSNQAFAHYVADASGNRALMGRILGQRLYSRFFRKISVFGYFENAGRLSSPLQGNVFFQTYDRAWMWHIPLNDHLTSVGVVMPADESGRIQQGAREALDYYIVKCPLIKKFLKNATSCREIPYNEVRIRSEYSYSHSCFWMPGGLLIGDAACFVDVLLSSGVHLATYSALLAARSINAILGDGLEEEVCMNEFETRYRLEYALFYQGLIGLYDMNQHSDDYITWLRSLLRNTNGVFIEWNEAEKQAPAGTKSTAIEHSRENVKTMRTYVAEQIEYHREAGMMLEHPIPPVSFPLTPSSTHLSWIWRRNVTAPSRSVYDNGVHS